MKEILLTCPFTGIEFSALESIDGNLIVVHPLTGEQLKINWNASCKRYNIPKSFFKKIDIVTQTEAMEILNVSHQRISQIAREQIIPTHVIAGKTVFLRDDVENYRDTRKVGAPRKIKDSGK